MSGSENLPEELPVELEQLILLAEAVTTGEEASLEKQEMLQG